MKIDIECESQCFFLNKVYTRKRSDGHSKLRKRPCLMKSQSWWYYIDASIKLVVYFERFFLFFFFSFFFPLRKRYSIAPGLDHEFFTNSNIAATFFSPLYLSLSVSRLNGDWKHFQTRFWDNLRFPKLIGFTAPIHSVFFFFCSLSLTYLLSLSHWFIFNRTRQIELPRWQVG